MIRTANLTGSVSRNAGGLFESVRRLVQSLADTGIEVRVFGTQDEFTAADVAAWSSVKVSAFKPSWPEQFGYSPRFLEELSAFAPDLTHTHGIWLYPSVATNHYCRRSSSPYLISTHGMLDPWALQHSRWRKLIAYLLYEEAHLRGASCLRALCPAEARAIRAAGLKNPVAVIPNGIDLPMLVLENAEMLKTETLKSECARRTADAGNRKAENKNGFQLSAFTGGRKVLLYLGRIHPKKGLVNLLRAWKQTLNSQPSALNQWVLAIAGWDQGGHEAELKRLATDLGIPRADVREKPQSSSRSAFQHVSFSAFSLLFLGPQFGGDKAACYQGCDAFILPSYSEGLPMVILEAWACGKPVLMTPECNLPEGFDAGAAVRVEPGVASLEAGLRALFEMSDSDRQTLGQRGRNLVSERFAWPKIAAEMKRLYEWMLGGGAKPSCLTPY